jgi:hypothetical protein
VHVVWLGGLDLADSGAEVGDIERVVVVTHHFTAMQTGQIVCPDADVARRIVVSANIENLLAQVLE